MKCTKNWDADSRESAECLAFSRQYLM